MSAKKRNSFAPIAVLTLITAVPLWGCDDSAGSSADAGTDTDADTDTEADGGADTESDTGEDCSDEDPFDPGSCPAVGEDDSRIRYVDADASEGGDGLSWATAFRTVRPAIDAARCVVLALGGTAQVWVAEGTYYIHQGCMYDAVRLREEVELYGGFAGIETTLDGRDWEAHATILDGHASEDSLDRVLHVVWGSDGALIDGFAITGGYAYSVELIPTYRDFRGAGMINAGASPVVRHCTFFGNEAPADKGGAVANLDGAAPLFEQCEFTDNISGMVGGAMASDGAAPTVTSCSFSGNTAQVGGAMVIIDSPNALITDSTFVENIAGQGGGLWIAGSSATLERCTFMGNTEASGTSVGGALSVDISEVVVRDSVLVANSADYGGAVTNAASTVQFESCEFSGNSAAYGGVIYDRDSAITSYINCTFTGNTADTAGGVLVGAFDPTESTFVNSILWDNDPDPIALYEGAAATVDYTDIEGGYDGGVGNIDADPLFVDAASGDFHLAAGSPCIDAADGDAAPELDFDGQSRWDDPAVANTGVGTPDYADMGAYERQAE